MSETKMAVVAGLVEAAIAQACLMPRPISKSRPRIHQTLRKSCGGRAPRRPLSGKYLETIKGYMKTVREFGCSHLLDNIIERVLNTKSMSHHEALGYARVVMLPMINLLVQPSQETPLVELPFRFFRITGRNHQADY